MVASYAIRDRERRSKIASIYHLNTYFVYSYVVIIRLRFSRMEVKMEGRNPRHKTAVGRRWRLRSFLSGVNYYFPSIIPVFFFSLPPRDKSPSDRRNIRTIIAMRAGFQLSPPSPSPSPSPWRMLAPRSLNPRGASSGSVSGPG